MNKRVIITSVLIIVLVFSFWTTTRYPSLNEKGLGDIQIDEPSLGFDTDLIYVDKTMPTYKQVIYSTFNWGYTMKEGMLFGILLGTLFLILFSFIKLDTKSNSFISSLKGLLLGSPLGVCVNCSTPIGIGMYKSGLKTETSLATMLSSPTLNFVSIILLFGIFPSYFVITKILITLILILLIIPCIVYLFSKNKKINIFKSSASSNKIIFNESWFDASKEIALMFKKNFIYLFKITFPLMILAGFLGVLLITFLPLSDFINVEPNFLVFLIFAMVGTFLPVPIFFDIIFAHSLMISGLNMGLVMVLLFTLGTYSIYSFLIVYKKISKKISILIFISVIIIGMGAGYGVNIYDEYRTENILNMYDSNMNYNSSDEFGQNEELVDSSEELYLEDRYLQNQNFQHMPGFAPRDFIVPISLGESGESITNSFYEVMVESQDHFLREGSSIPFTKIPGVDLGFIKSNTLSEVDFFFPFYYGRGIAAGDFNRDGLEDVVIATNNGIIFYKNLGDYNFEHQEISGSENLNIMLVAPVDIDNDGWLDIFFSSYEQGNHFILNDKQDFNSNLEMIEVLIPDIGLITSASFSDIGSDGYLDFVVGNTHIKNFEINRKEPDILSENKLIINKNLDFEIINLDRNRGDSLSILFSDFYGDNSMDLMIGKDFSPPDIFYIGSKDLYYTEIFSELIEATVKDTMSFDTGDINNDLNLEIYVAGRSSSKSLIENLIDTPIEDSAAKICGDIGDLNENKKCVQYIILFDILKDGDIELCNEENFELDINELGFDPVRVCMLNSMFKLSSDKRDHSLCNKIPSNIYVFDLCNSMFSEDIPYVLGEKFIDFRMHENSLLMYDGDKFKNVARQFNVHVAEWGWNSKFADLDNDEWQDIYSVNGFQLSKFESTNIFFHNDKGMNFYRRESEFGLEDYLNTFSYIYIDVDNDGDLDIITFSFNGQITLYKNNNLENSITFEFMDEIGNKFGIGTKIYIFYGDGKKHQVREIKSGGGYLSFDSYKAHFGLGNNDKINKLEIIWSDGEKSTIIQDLSANKNYIISRVLR